MAAVAAPSAADIERFYDPQNMTMRYDAKRDTLMVHVGWPRPAISYDVLGEAWIRYVPDTKEVVGIEIENFESYFLKRHPEIAERWRSTNARKILRKRSSAQTESFLNQLVKLLKASLPGPSRPQAVST
jgi:hypothetical protein